MKRLAHFLVTAAVAVAGACVLAPSAGACVLAGPPPVPWQKVAAADVAFTGKVIAAAPLPDFAGVGMTVEVDRVLKGSVPRTVQLVSGMTSCSAAFAAGTRVGLALKPTTPMPWQSSTFDDVGAAQLDLLPVEAAYVPLKVAGLAGRPGRRTLQVHVTAHSCTTLRPVLEQGPRGIAVSVSGADGPRCLEKTLADRCVTVTAKRRLGKRSLRPVKARRVPWADAARCPASASS